MTPEVDEDLSLIIMLEKIKPTRSVTLPRDFKC